MPPTRTSLRQVKPCPTMKSLSPRVAEDGEKALIAGRVSTYCKPERVAVPLVVLTLIPNSREPLAKPVNATKPLGTTATICVVETTPTDAESTSRAALAPEAKSPKRTSGLPRKPVPVIVSNVPPATQDGAMLVIVGG